MVFEYTHWLKNVLDLINSNNSAQFAQVYTSPNFNYGFADYCLYRLPNPRRPFYEDLPHFDEMKTLIMIEHNELITKLGYYPIKLEIKILDNI